MSYLEFPIQPEDGVRALVLSYQERASSCFKEYMFIRDHHYFTKNHWEPHGGEDKYDQFSTYLLITSEDQVMVGGRIITDVIGLPVREVLRERNLPTEQVPVGSYEISRFVAHPTIQHSRKVIVFLGYFAQALCGYCKTQQIENSYGVLISVLEKWFKSIGVKIERLPYPATKRRGSSTFNTVRFITSESVPLVTTRDQRPLVQTGLETDHFLMCP